MAEKSIKKRRNFDVSPFLIYRLKFLIHDLHSADFAGFQTHFYAVGMVGRISQYISYDAFG